jgi:hypothetical protein
MQKTLFLFSVLFSFTIYAHSKKSPIDFLKPFDREILYSDQCTVIMSFHSYRFGPHRMRTITINELSGFSDFPKTIVQLGHSNNAPASLVASGASKMYSVEIHKQKVSRKKLTLVVSWAQKLNGKKKVHGKLVFKKNRRGDLVEVTMEKSKKRLGIKKSVYKKTCKL